MFPSHMTNQIAHDRNRDDRRRAEQHRRGAMRWRSSRTGRIGEARR